MAWNVEGKLNVKDKYMCYFHKESQIFEVGPLFLQKKKKKKKYGEDIEIQRAEYLWNNYKSLVSRVKSSSHDVMVFFKKNWKIRFIGPYPWIPGAENIRMSKKVIWMLKYAK